MTAPVSLVVPTLNAATALARTAASWMEGVASGLVCELVIADGGSTDATLEVAETLGAVVVSGPPGRGQQLIAGAAAAKGAWLLFLHADTALSARWPEALARHMADAEADTSGGVRAGYFHLRYDSAAPEARWLERRAALRVRLMALPYGDQGLLIHRDHYTQLGGYRPLRLMEDVDLVRRIGRRGLAALGAEAITSADKYVRDGWRKRAWSNAWLLAQYLTGADPDRLARRYR
jgi:rSAM/selenodomain-associated transferase 2